MYDRPIFLVMGSLIVKMNYFIFGTNNMKKAIEFYDALFDGCGVDKVYSEGRMTLWTGDEFMFAVAEPFNGEPATNGNGTMLGLSVGSAGEVERLYGKALELGGTDEGSPSIRSNRHSAYIRDLDGNKICLFE
jgi:predicted lactoylglutathione lyase